jgi:SAM-dependent methyltransferase
MSEATVEFDCPICGSRNQISIYPDTLGESLPEFGYDFSPRHCAHYRIVRCPDCSHAYCSPRHPDMFQNYVDVVDYAYLKNQEQRVATAMRVISKISGFKSHGRLLDIGCSTGDFLLVAEKVYAVEGLELSDWAADAAEGRGLTIHRKQLAEFEPGAPYDLITLWGVIEHFEYPAQELANVSRLLKPGGLVCLWTGDFDSVFSKLLGDRWWYILGQHIQYFTRRSIERLFLGQGYSLISSSYYPYVMSFNTIAKSLARYPAIERIFKGFITRLGIGHWNITIRLPGEMFLIFRKD